MYALPWRATLGGLILLPLLTACGSDDPALPDFDAHPVTVTPAEQWAGGAIVLSSTALADWAGDELPLLIGDDVGEDAYVIAHRSGDSTFTAILPDTLPGGHQIIRAAVIEYPSFVTGLDVAGWTDTRSLALTGTSRYSVAWPVVAPTGLLLVKDDTIRFVRATDGGVVTFPATTMTYRVPLGYDAAGHVLAPWSFDTLRAWSLDLALGTATVASATAQPTDVDVSYHRFEAGVNLYTDHNYLDFEPGTLQHLSYITSPRPITSTATGRAVIPHREMTPDPGGIPIFRTDSGTIAGFVLGYDRLDAATFNATGTVLYMAASVAGMASTTSSILRVDPATGTIQDSVPVTAGPRVEDLSVDAANGWLFEAVRDSLHWTLRIRDASTLALIAELRSPTTNDGCRAEGELHILPMLASDEVYLGSADCKSGPGEVSFARFTVK